MKSDNQERLLQSLEGTANTSLCCSGDSSKRWGWKWSFLFFNSNQIKFWTTEGNWSDRALNIHVWQWKEKRPDPEKHPLAPYRDPRVLEQQPQPVDRPDPPLLKVGAHLKTPSYPIWVVCSESHFSVLFGLQRELLTSKDQHLEFDLYYYDGLANQQEEIRLTVSM